MNLKTLYLFNENMRTRRNMAFRNGIPQLSVKKDLSGNRRRYIPENRSRLSDHPFRSGNLTTRSRSGDNP